MKYKWAVISSIEGNLFVASRHTTEALARKTIPKTNVSGLMVYPIQDGFIVYGGEGIRIEDGYVVPRISLKDKEEFIKKIVEFGQLLLAAQEK